MRNTHRPDPSPRPPGTSGVPGTSLRTRIPERGTTPARPSGAAGTVVGRPPVKERRGKGTRSTKRPEPPVKHPDPPRPTVAGARGPGREDPPHPHPPVVLFHCSLGDPVVTRDPAEGVGETSETPQFVHHGCRPAGTVRGWARAGGSRGVRRRGGGVIDGEPWSVRSLHSSFQFLWACVWEWGWGRARAVTVYTVAVGPTPPHLTFIERQM